HPSHPGEKYLAGRSRWTDRPRNGRTEPVSAEESSSGPTLIPVALLLTLTCVLLLTNAAPPDPYAVPADGPDDGMPLLQRAARAEDEVAYPGGRRVPSVAHVGQMDT